MNEINVSITKKNLNKILHYAQAAYDEHKAEIGGMAICVKGEDNEWTIENPIILSQEITGTNCTLDQTELANYYADTASIKKYKNKDWRFLWWHSHHMMDAFWSGTDLTAIDEFSDGDLSFALVVNLKGDYLVRASAWNIGMHQDMDLEVLDTTSNIPEKILNEVNDKCKTRTFTTISRITSGNQLSLADNYNYKVKSSNNSTINKEETQFEADWEELVEKIEENIGECVHGKIDVQELRGRLAKMNGILSKKSKPMRIEYSNIRDISDILTLQAYEIVEVDDKFEKLRDTLTENAMDYYAYNWSYGLGRRYH